MGPHRRIPFAPFHLGRVFLRPRRPLDTHRSIADVRPIHFLHRRESVHRLSERHEAVTLRLVALCITDYLSLGKCSVLAEEMRI